MVPNTWLTNRRADSNTWLTHQLKNDVDWKVLQFINTMIITKLLGYKTLWHTNATLVTKPYGIQTQQLLQEKDELGHMSLVHNMFVKNFCIDVHQLWQSLKQFLYMFKAVRKENPNIYTWIGVKSDLKNWFS